jgi:hypothetical protein
MKAQKTRESGKIIDNGAGYHLINKIILFNVCVFGERAAPMPARWP